MPSSANWEELGLFEEMKERRAKLLGWPKSLFGFFISCNRKTCMSFLANPIQGVGWGWEAGGKAGGRQSPQCSRRSGL